MPDVARSSRRIALHRTLSAVKRAKFGKSVQGTVGRRVGANVAVNGGLSAKTPHEAGFLIVESSAGKRAREHTPLLLFFLSGGSERHKWWL